MTADVAILLERIAAHPRALRRNAAAIRSPGEGARCVVYWMQRAQRGVDNPALDAAVFAANELKLPLAVFLAPFPRFPRATARAYSFLFEGFADVRRAVERRGAAFVFRSAAPIRIDAFAAEAAAALVIGDENPLRETEAWRTRAAGRLDVALVTIDADVVVPSVFFEKEEWAAYTIRPKIHARLAEWLAPSPEHAVKVRFARGAAPASEEPRTGALPAAFRRDVSATATPFFRGGTGEGLARLERFLAGNLARYPERRNRPEDENGTSRISPYLHFGHLGPRMVAAMASRCDAPQPAKDAFLEQLIVRRELAWNFVRRNPRYDEFSCAAPWAAETLAKRGADPRPYTLSKEQLEFGRSPDPLWNAAQNEMRVTGYMHNHMRMYWAKKLLEWSRTPEDAYALAVEFNDRYELDGRDPNGYAGIAWAIAGKHDRPFAPGRAVFGTIRPMTLASTSRKFDAKEYIARCERLAAEASR